MKHTRKPLSPNDNWPDFNGASSWWLKSKGRVMPQDAEQILVTVFPTVSRSTGSLHIFHEPTFGIDTVASLHKVHNLSIPSGADRLISVTLFDTATREAQNAALKLLEEPPVDHILIFITPNTTRLLPTVTSRMQHADVIGYIDEESAMAFLAAPVAGRLKIMETWLKAYDAGEINRHDILACMLHAYDHSDINSLEATQRSSIQTALAIITSTDGSLKVALEVMALLLPRKV